MKKSVTSCCAALLYAGLILGCSGVAPRSPQAEAPVSAETLASTSGGGADLRSYRSWRPLRAEPMVRGGNGELWSLFGLPGSSVKNGRFSRGVVLVKEIRRLVPGNPTAAEGEVIRLAVMRKVTDRDWEFRAYDGKRFANDTSIDTDGCMLCHEDKKDQDFTFRAMDVFDTRPDLTPPP